MSLGYTRFVSDPLVGTTVEVGFCCALGTAQFDTLLYLSTAQFDTLLYLSTAQFDTLLCFRYRTVRHCCALGTAQFDTAVL
jgi:hypothetical protein